MTEDATLCAFAATVRPFVPGCRCVRPCCAGRPWTRNAILDARVPGRACRNGSDAQLAHFKLILLAASEARERPPPPFGLWRTSRRTGRQRNRSSGRRWLLGLLLLGLLEGSGGTKMQVRDRRALFREPSFEILQFKLGQLGLEQALITLDVSQMGTQTATLVHCHLSKMHLVLIASISS